MPDKKPTQQEIMDHMCPNCVTPWKCNGPHIPAALPAEVDVMRATRIHNKLARQRQRGER